MTQTHIKHTTGRCPRCFAPLAAEVFEEDAKVYVRRTCPEHGETVTCIASDARFYYPSTGSGGNGGCGAECGCSSGDASANRFDTLSTCIALIEIVDSCNLACPTCYAASPQSHAVDCLPLAQCKVNVESVIARKGPIEILQLSGGEPTLHPQFFELLDWAQRHEKIDYVLINTNGIRIATDAAFREALEAAILPGKVQLYLQYDGPEAAGQAELRGADLRKQREKVLDFTAAMGNGGLPVTLAMTVTRQNIGQLWATVAAGLARFHVRGVSFQPRTLSGRNPEVATVEAPLAVADVITGLMAQSEGLMTADDFTPLPCGDPNCHTISYLLRGAEQVVPVGRLVDLRQLQGFLKDRVNYNLDDLRRCGCDAEPLGEVLKNLELDESHTFRIFIKPFMDAHTWDEDRIDRCCTHVIRKDGSLDSFCRYYSGFPDVSKPTVEAARCD